jgi:hypothetical protein
MYNTNGQSWISQLQIFHVQTINDCKIFTRCWNISLEDPQNLPNSSKLHVIWPDTTSNTLAFLQHPNPPRPHCLLHSFQRLQELPPSRANPWRCCRLVRNQCCSAPAGQAAGRNCFCWGWKFTFQAGGIPKSQAVLQFYTPKFYIKSHQEWRLQPNYHKWIFIGSTYTNLDLHILSTCPKATSPSPAPQHPAHPVVQSSLGCKTSLVDATGFRRSIFKGSPQKSTRAPLMFPDLTKNLGMESIGKRCLTDYTWWNSDIWSNWRFGKRWWMNIKKVHQMS